MSETTRGRSEARLLVWAILFTAAAYGVMAALGNVVTVQSATDPIRFGEAAAAAGNRVRLALLTDTVAFLPGYATTVVAWCRWRLARMDSWPQPWFQRPLGAAQRLVVLAAAADFAENLLVYAGLGTVDLSSSAAAAAVSPAAALMAALRWTSGCKWALGAAALAAVAVAGIAEIATRRQSSHATG